MKFSKLLIVTIFVISLILALIIPNYHDYSSYVKQWNIIYNGEDPYINTGNAYGVFYNFFAYIGLFRFIAIPRFIFVLIYLIAGYLIWKKSINYKMNLWVLIFLFFNPLFWIFCVKYGNNDSFLAGTTLIGVFLYYKKRFLYSGILLSIAVCFKFIPLFIIPFFIFSRKKINYKFFFSIASCTAIIYSLGFYLWGNSIVEPFIFGNKRPSTLLSIFRFIRGKIEPLSFLNINNLDSYSTIIIIFSFVVLFYFYIRYNLDRYLMSLLALSFLIVLYKVSNHQFYISFLLFSAFVMVENYKLVIHNKKIILSYFLFWIWIFALTILYDFTAGYSNTFNKFGRIIHIIGLPTFILHNIYNFYLIKLVKQKREIALKININ